MRLQLLWSRKHFASAKNVLFNLTNNICHILKEGVRFTENGTHCFICWRSWLFQKCKGARSNLLSMIETKSLDGEKLLAKNRQLWHLTRVPIQKKKYINTIRHWNTSWKTVLLRPRLTKKREYTLQIFEPWLNYQYSRNEH